MILDILHPEDLEKYQKEFEEIQMKKIQISRIH